MNDHDDATGESGPRLRLRRYALVAGLMMLGTVVTALGSNAFATTRPHTGVADKATPSCSIVTAAQIKSTLGVVVSKPTVVTTGSTSTCKYGTAHIITIQFVGDYSKTIFDAFKSAVGKSYTAVNGLGNGALTSTAGAGSYSTTSLIVWDGTTELAITSYQMSATKEEALAKVLLPSL